MKKTQIAIFVVISIIAILALISLSKPKANVSQSLPGIEVDNFKGEKLTPISETPALGIKGVQKIDVSNYKLSVEGLAKNKISYTYDEVINKYQSYTKVVTLNCVEGWSAKILWEGVLIEDLINDAQVYKDANTVVFYSLDGYTTSLPLDYIKAEKIILAYKMNGVTLPEDHGFPFRVVAESKYGYKWAKWVTKIELTNDPNYKGYWEERGFSNDANISTP
ncbi:molybdopterin-dependent oxidoreductase [Caldisericum sp.]|uniref:molybdopterin-dependent oxidoreductase n=1 Tax=Caldisericum sp. TaxID=2499687 RepID=UPI003D121E95